MTRCNRRRSGPLDDAGDDRLSPPGRPELQQILERRLGRRDLLAGALRSTALGVGLFAIPTLPVRGATTSGTDRFEFTEIRHGIDGTHHVPPGYEAEVLIRWGDPLFEDAPSFDPDNQSSRAQARQFGYNNDFIGFIPLQRTDDTVTRAVLCVNHEYTNEELMIPRLGPQERTVPPFRDMTAELVGIEMAAHGASLFEIVRVDGRWRVDRAAPRNRRLTVGDTGFAISGPAAGSARMATRADPAGRKVVGTVNNCAGGVTPWGTFLIAEENFNVYFSGDIEATGAEQENHLRYGVPVEWYAWGDFDDRFDISVEPNEPNRFGWVVEVDPHDPASVPVKRTALGRMKHEGARCLASKDGRVAIYMGDDQSFEYLYKFVSHDPVNPDDPSANRDLLDSGTLSVAVFNEDGTVSWKPLVYGQGGLDERNGFTGQADVLIETRRAADILGATPLDRPEDVDGDGLGNVFVLLTYNKAREAAQVDAVNARARNRWGQIIQLHVEGADHAADTCRWSVLVQCGDPKDASVNATWNPATSENGWFSCPDNCAVDHRGRLWVSTDQGMEWKTVSGTADGLWALETEGPRRGTGKMFFRAPVGAELCGPCFSDDDTTLFVAVQHVAADGARDYPGFGRDSSYEDPATRWPDFDPQLPPRPALVAITRRGGGKIG